MSLALFSDQDNSFFTVVTKNSAFASNGVSDLSGDVVSITIKEAVNKLTTGTLKLYDPNNVYSLALREGVQLEIEWGYREFGDSEIEDAPSDQYTGARVRRGMTALVQDPGGTAGENGVIIYNCNFVVLKNNDWKFKKNRRFEFTSKKDIVSKVMKEMGVDTLAQSIDFDAQSEKVTSKNPIRQDNVNNFRFLTKMALENGALFRMGFDSTGIMRGIFMDAGRLAKSDFAKRIIGATGGSVYNYHYMGGISNVKSYNWSRKTNNEGGDSVRVHYVNGNPQFVRYQIDSESVKTWKFNPEKLRAEAKRIGITLGVEALIRRANELLNINDFNELVRLGYFTLVNSRTYVPQGLGYEINLEVVGDPMITVPSVAKFGGAGSEKDSVQVGFPNRFFKKNFTFYTTGVTHTLDAKGYKCQVNIIDAFAIFARRIAL